MIITLDHSYPKLEAGKRKLDKHGNPITVFVYKVTGSKEELDRYEKIQSANGAKTIKDENGDYLWFTVNPVGLEGKLGISVNDKIYADTTAVDLANSLMKNYGAAGTLMAKDLLSKGFVSNQPKEISEENEVLDDLK